jgi:hypothetical protein
MHFSIKNDHIFQKILAQLSIIFRILVKKWSRIMILKADSLCVTHHQIYYSLLVLYIVEN